VTISTSIQVDPKLKALLENLKKVDTAVKEECWNHTMDSSLEMEAQIKSEMPLDTGRAKASWGHFTPEDLVEGAERVSKSKTGKRVRFRTVETRRSPEGQIASASDAIWEENQAEGWITQGTHVPYVQQLDEGHSLQAPKLFIEAAETRLQAKFNAFGEQLGKMIGDVLAGRGIHLTKTGKIDRRYKK
jgi:hypothetical protein